MLYSHSLFRSAKVLSSIETEPIEIDRVCRTSTASQEDILEPVAAIRLQESIDFMVEPKTGFKFPVTLSPVGYKEGLEDGSFNQVSATPAGALVGAMCLECSFIFLRCFFVLILHTWQN